MSFLTVSVHSHDLESLCLTDAPGHLLHIFLYRGECICLPAAPLCEQQEHLGLSSPICNHALLLQKHKSSGTFFFLLPFFLKTHCVLIKYA